jgi:hypothetical protein
MGLQFAIHFRVRPTNTPTGAFAALRFDLDERNVVEEDKRVRKLRPFPFPARVSVDEVTGE